MEQEAKEAARDWDVAGGDENGVAKLRSMGRDDTWLPEGVTSEEYNNGG